MASHPIPVDELSTDERIALIERLWDSLEADIAAPISDSLRKELARREAEADLEPNDGESWEAIRDRLVKTIR